MLYKGAEYQGRFFTQYKYANQSKYIEYHNYKRYHCKQVRHTYRLNKAGRQPTHCTHNAYDGTEYFIKRACFF